MNYLAYLTYTPLLIAGPTMTFNSWISHTKLIQNSHTTKQTIIYVLRVVFIFVTFEIFTHLYYCYAVFVVNENFHLIYEFSLRQLAVHSLFALVYIWYKFLTIWRIMRAWALLDGYETAENMNRCIFNNFCFEQFWRSWHRSFNQWLIRYIFIPWEAQS